MHRSNPGIRALPLAALALACGSVLAADIEPRVLAQARADGRTEALIVMADQLRPALAPLAPDADYRARRRALVDALRARAEHQQADVRAWLEARGIENRPYWISNAIWARLSAQDLDELAMRADVARVAANPSFSLDVPEAPLGPVTNSLEAIEWGVNMIRAPEVWAEGFEGQGVVIAGQDTGYDWDHPALVNHYRGWDGAVATHDYNWHDSIHNSSGNPCGNDSPQPCDDHGHGTHTAGTFAGSDGGANQIGVAPGAKWIGCRNMNSGDGTPARYIECMEFFLAPTDMAGQNANPDLAPDVINNSWGCPASEGCTPADILETAVDNLVAAGIMFVVSAGNDGSGCSSILTPPAIYDSSFVIGSTTSSDVMSSFSSRGPVSGSGLIRPDVSAPGSSIRSSVPGGGYASMSGTSMAGPHVAGAAALVMSVNPALKGHPDQVAQILRDTAVPINLTQTCGGIGPDTWPNYVAGYGRIDAYAAALAAQPGSPVSVDIAFMPASVAVEAPSELVLTLANGGAAPAVLTADLVHGLPGDLHAVDPVQASTTCPSGAVVVAGDFSTFQLQSGAVIPAGDDCTVTITVSAPTPGTYESTIDAGALQTDMGANPVAVSAALEVTDDDTLFEDGFDGAPVR
jgi:subtilisin family serine protease